MFLVKKHDRENKTCKIHYVRMDDFWRKEEKLQWLTQNPLRKIPFEIVRPDKNNNWINIADNDFESLLPLCSKEVKFEKSQKALFRLYTSTIKTNRDEWVFDFDRTALINKVEYFIAKYNHQIQTKKYDNDKLDYSIKWSRDLKLKLIRQDFITYSEDKFSRCLFRPFVFQWFYSEKILNDVLSDNHYQISGYNLSLLNSIINISGSSSLKPFQVVASDLVPNYDFLEKTQCLPLYRYDKNGSRIDNITDWGLDQFVKQYNDDTITKQKIFHYVYAVLHNPAYRKKYELNLKREFPRIPFYDDFRQWTAWGEQLMNLHINYETIEPYKLQIADCALPEGVKPKPKLNADKAAGIIILDSQTELHGIPAEAWDYKLGNRSALEWILDQYQEKKPKDPTIAEKFNTYRFADYKEQVIDLLKRVCAVSVQTIAIIKNMENKQDISYGA